MCLHGSLFVIAAEEADVLDLLSISVPICFWDPLNRTQPPPPPPSSSSRDGRVSRVIATLAPGLDVLPVQMSYFIFEDGT